MNTYTLPILFFPNVFHCRTGKSMERIINTRLKWLFETNNVIANEQAGFRIHRSTNKHIAKLSQFISHTACNVRYGEHYFKYHTLHRTTAGSCN